MRILVLYCEIMPYNVIAFESLLKINPEVQIDVISWGKQKKLTPFQPLPLDRVNYYDEKNFEYNDLKNLYLLNRYELVYVCNRREKKYLKLASFVKNDLTIVIGQSDEQLYNSPRQYLKKIFSYYLYRRHFDYMFVPGYYQYEFMRFLNFKKDRILIGAYTANVKLFNDYYENNINKFKLNSSTINLLYIGRLEDEKGIVFLLKTLYNLKNRFNFKLVIIGNGSLKNIVLKYDFVEYHSFLEQKHLLNLLNDISFFILPSIYEPWGVVIHEMVAAGIPVICSDACGAKAAFVFDNYNGYIFKNKSSVSLTNTLIKSFSISEKKLYDFKIRSNELSKSITPDLWGETINSFIS